MVDSAFVEMRDFEEANLFLEYLRPTGERWASRFIAAGVRSVEPAWVFRGQRDATWGLLPSAWRRDSGSDFGHLTKFFRVLAGLRKSQILEMKRGRYERERLEEVIVRLMCELEAIHRFSIAADKLGIHVGNLDSVLSGIKFFEEYDEIRLLESITSNRVDRMFLKDVAALSQHHGIPTRLLDWTESALIAAYFAADKVGVDDGGRIAVWALNLEFDFRRFGIELVRVPRYNFVNLHAQKGLFTWWPGDAFYLEQGRYPELADNLVSLTEGEVGEMEEGSIPKPIRVATLPFEEVLNLRRLLWKEDITVASMKPSLDSVGLGVRERWALEDVGDEHMWSG